MNKRYISLADFLMLIVFFILMLISVKPVFADEHSHEYHSNKYRSEMKQLAWALGRRANPW